MRSGFIIFFAMSVSFTHAASAQDYRNNPVYEDKLIGLADVLGRVHAVRVLCNGQGDQYWREYMRNLLDLEAPAAGYRRSRMVDSFNAGYSSEQSRFATCTPEAAQSESDLSTRGRQLSESLASLAAGITP